MTPGFIFEWMSSSWSRASRSSEEMRERAERTAALEQEVRTRQHAENDARSLASLTSAVGLALTKPATLDRMLQSCAEALVADLNGVLARIWTLNEGDQVLELRASGSADGSSDTTQQRVPIGRSAIGAIAENRAPYVTNSERVDLHLDDPDWALREGIVAFAGYPLLVDSKLVGVMATLLPTRIFGLRDGTMRNGGRGCLGIERKRAEAELARHTQHLQDHTTPSGKMHSSWRRSSRICACAETPEAATRAKSDFLAR